MDFLTNLEYQNLMPSMYAILAYIVVLFLTIYSDDSNAIKNLTKDNFLGLIILIYIFDIFLYSIFLSPWVSTIAFFTQWPTVTVFFTEWPWFEAFFTQWPTITYIIDNYSEKLIISAIVLTIYLIYLKYKLNKKESLKKGLDEEVKKNK